VSGEDGMRLNLNLHQTIVVPNDIVSEEHVSNSFQLQTKFCNIEASDLMKMDRAIIDKVRTGFGLAAQDGKEVTFLPNKGFGMDVKSFLLADLEATARELECGLNGEQPHCQSMRARMQTSTVRSKVKEK
jgi:hypothetical protein